MNGSIFYILIISLRTNLTITSCIGGIFSSLVRLDDLLRLDLIQWLQVDLHGLLADNLSMFQKMSMLAKTQMTYPRNSSKGFCGCVTHGRSTVGELFNQKRNQRLNHRFRDGVGCELPQIARNKLEQRSVNSPNKL